ncbi:hypothetical protein COB64_04365 [Candidatus Wolfebacteria bacterium]|nr:MAG: hypothetical protein COB64_04365 [Candidatus Wolfebacteria bacterium]
MATIKKRINISVSKDIEQMISKLAKRDQVPEATKAAHLIRIALEIEEDQIWDEIANVRDKKGVKFISHKVAWK